MEEQGGGGVPIVNEAFYSRGKWASHSSYNARWIDGTGCGLGTGICKAAHKVDPLHITVLPYIYYDCLNDYAKSRLIKDELPKNAILKT